MTTSEFSSNFDIKLNSFSTVPGFGYTHSPNDIVLDEYEKSLFLTEAQELIVTELYTGRSTIQLAFESTEELRSYLRSLIKEEKLEEQTSIRSNYKCQAFKLPKDLLYITYEEVILEDENAVCHNGARALVIPVTQDEFYRTVLNPFRGPSTTRVLRIDSSDATVELVSNYHIGEYYMKYLKNPSPIILTDLEEGLMIRGYNTVTECELNPVLHNTILDRAVGLALRSKVAQSK